MNPYDEIKALKEERGALKSQLVVGMDKEERIAIHQRIASIDQQITGWIGRLPLVVGTMGAAVDHGPRCATELI